jgi:hypothetical protein
MTALLLPWLFSLQGAAVLDNDHVRIVRDSASCELASASCVHRIVVARDTVELETAGAKRTMARGDIAVFGPGDSYRMLGGGFFEVVIKPGHPPALAPAVTIAAGKNALLHDSADFFVFEERLAPGDTRARHSHSQRVVIQLNRTRLQQWPDGEPEKLVETIPDRPTFSPPVIHVVKNVGHTPLRGIVIEFKPK